MHISSLIDHTLLKPTAVTSEIEKLCDEAKRFNFAAVCVPPPMVKLSAELLKDSTQRVATIIGFPFGYSVEAAKLDEVNAAMQDGADELDMVINLLALKNKWWKLLESEASKAISAVHAQGKIIKLIIESGLLSDEEIIICCDMYASLGVDFVKTSTGYAETGATVHAVQLMRKHLPDTIQVKASGGIRTYESAMDMVKAGATRLGCSASVAIVQQQPSTANDY